MGHFWGQFTATSPDLTLHGGVFTEQYQNGLESGTEIIPNYPDFMGAIPKGFTLP